MKTHSLLRVILFVIIAGIMSLSCSPTGTSKVTIHINLGSLNQHTFNIHKDSIFDKVFRLFAKDAEAQTVPSNISSLTLNVTAADMETLTQSYNTPSIPSDISVDVPAGSSRNFELIAFINPSDSSAVISYRGTAISDLVAGTTEDISISMGIYETKIIIPDYNNNRIVQIDDLSGNGWSIRSAISGISNLRPYDIDFDNLGRIYIANNNATTDNDVVIRIDSITGSIVSSFGANGSGYVAIALDRINNVIYCARAGVNTIWLYDLNGTLLSQITLPAVNFTTIRGLAVDNSGDLYIAATTTSGSVQEVIKCTPGNPSTNVIRYSTNLYTPWDVAVKGNNVYVANFDVSNYNNDKITQLTDQLQFQNELIVDPANTDHFYGPHRFLAILNRKFFIMDDGTPSSNMDRIISFDDISGTNWTPYGSTGSGTDQFLFYEYFVC